MKRTQQQNKELELILLTIKIKGLATDTEPQKL